MQLVYAPGMDFVCLGIVAYKFLPQFQLLVPSIIVNLNGEEARPVVMLRECESAFLFHCILLFYYYYEKIENWVAFLRVLYLSAYCSIT